MKYAAAIVLALLLSSCGHTIIRDCTICVDKEVECSALQGEELYKCNRWLINACYHCSAMKKALVPIMHHPFQSSVPKEAYDFCFERELDMCTTAAGGVSRADRKSCEQVASMRCTRR